MPKYLLLISIFAISCAHKNIQSDKNRSTASEKPTNKQLSETNPTLKQLNENENYFKSLARPNDSESYGKVCAMTILETIEALRYKNKEAYFSNKSISVHSYEKEVELFNKLVNHSNLNSIRFAHPIAWGPVNCLVQLFDKDSKVLGDAFLTFGKSKKLWLSYIELK